MFFYNFIRILPKKYHKNTQKINLYKVEHLVVSKTSACVNLCANKENEVYAMLESMQKKVDKMESDNLGLLITIFFLSCHN